MKILADTCAWSLLLRRRDATALSSEDQLMLNALTDAIRDGSIAMIGPIRQELLSGIREPAQYTRLRDALGVFPDEPIRTDHYEEAARLYNLCRSRGVECGAIDILLCAVATRERWSILTDDAGLKRCLEVLRSEGIL